MQAWRARGSIVAAMVCMCAGSAPASPIHTIKKAVSRGKRKLGEKVKVLKGDGSLSSNSKQPRVMPGEKDNSDYILMVHSRAVLEELRESVPTEERRRQIFKVLEETPDDVLRRAYLLEAEVILEAHRREKQTEKPKHKKTEHKPRPKAHRRFSFSRKP